MTKASALVYLLLAMALVMIHIRGKFKLPSSGKKNVE